jgi:hypothetical protein
MKPTIQFEFLKTAIVNLGYISSLQGVRNILNQLKMNPFRSFIWRKLYTNGGTGVRKVLQSCLGGTPRSNIMIWGYSSSKRLRTPALKEMDLWKLQYLFLQKYFWA